MDVSTYTRRRPVTRYKVGPGGNGIKVPKWKFTATTLNRRPHHAIYCNAASHRNGYCQARVPAASWMPRQARSPGTSSGVIE